MAITTDPVVEAAFGNDTPPGTQTYAGPHDPAVEAAFADTPEENLSPLSVTASRAVPNPMPILDPRRLQGQDPSQVEAARRAVTPTSLDPLVNKAVGYVTGLPKRGGDLLQAYAREHGVENPYAQAAIGEIPQLAANVAATVLPFGAASKGEELAGEFPSFEEQEAGELSRLGDIHARAEAKGFDIPESSTPEGLAKSAANNQSISDNVIRNNFGLSKKAPLTPQMFDSWRGKFNAGNTYAEARAVPRVQLNDDAVESLGGLPKPLYDRLGLDKKIAPDNTISGTDSVDISQALRARASQFWKTSKMFPEYEDQAVSIDKAVDNLEDSVAPHLKDPNQWNLDRARNAQSYNVQSALDAGHVDVGDLARMKFAKGQIKPWTGDISDLADLGQLHPDAFRLTRIQPRSYGAIRKGLAWGAAAGASYAAGKAGLGAVSHIIGQGASDTITPP